MIFAIEQLHTCLSRLCWEINQAVNSDVRIYIGGETESIEEVYYSFRIARELMVSAAPGIEGCLVFSPAQDHSPVYDYTSEDARYLRQKAGMGSFPAVSERLCELYQRNSAGHARSAFERPLMYGHMVSTLLEAGYRSTLSKELTRGLTERKLSSLVRGQTGMTFAKYLEKLRIDSPLSCCKRAK